jgi:hypothetical protein
MRKGDNPTKGSKLIHKEECHHRIIIPLYIPHEHDYYKDAYKIFELCLFSLSKTASSKIKISIISNNSSAEINDRLFQLYKQGQFDELIIEREAIGKINSVLKALRTVEERLVTITDADVLFCNGWEEAVVEIFEAFPKAGAVCPVPVFRKHLHLTSNIWMNYIFSKKLYFRPVKNPEAMEKFANSIGWPWLDQKYKDVIASIEAKNGTIAVLGCSHFVATYKREVIEQIPATNTKYLLEGDSEFLYNDVPVLKMGGYRLATYDNYAYHLGNHFENWMQEAFDKLDVTEKYVCNYETLPLLKKSIIMYYLSEKILKKIFPFRKMQKFILKLKGLTTNQIKNF